MMQSTQKNHWAQGKTADLYLCVDTDGRFLADSPTACAKLLFSDSEIRELSLWDLVRADAKPSLQESIKQARSGQAMLDVETVFIGKEGQAFYLRGSIIPRWQEGDQIKGFDLAFYQTRRHLSEPQTADATGEPDILIDGELRLQNILTATQTGTWEWHVQKGTLLVNEYWAKMLGYSLRDLAPITIATWEHLIHPQDREKIMAAIEMLFNRKREQYAIDCRMRHQDGHWVWIRSCGKVMVWSCDQKPLWVFGTHVDISREKEKQEQIQKQNNLLHAVIQSSPDGVFVIDRDYTIRHTNRKIDERELPGRICHEVLQKSETVCSFCLAEKCLQTLEPQRTEIPFEHRSMEAFFFPLPDVDQPDRAAGFIEFIRDITPYKKAEQEIRRKTRELERFFTVNLDLLCISDLEGNFIKVNKAWEQILGYEAAQLENENFFNFIHPDDLAPTRKVMAALEKQEQVIDFVNRYHCRDGTYKYIEWRSHPYDGYIYAAARDITEHVRLQERLSVERDLFQMTLLSVGDGVLSTDAQGQVAVMNPIAEKLTGWRENEAKGQKLEQVLKLRTDDASSRPVDPASHVWRHGDIVSNREPLSLHSRDQKTVAVEYSAAPIQNQQKEITGIVLVLRDISEKREKQRQIEYLSYHDPLTDLYNRRYIEKMKQDFKGPKHLPLAVMMIDVNGLKLVNDVYGHAMGDRLLRHVAGLLRQSCRASDIIARMDGDEFCLLLPKTDASRMQTLQKEIEKSAFLNHMEDVIVSLAIGYAIRSQTDDSIENSIQLADNRMYQNKLKHGKTMRSQTVETVLRSINQKYDKEQIHTERVSQYADMIARVLGMRGKDLERLNSAAVLHDIGKITVPPELLNKPDKLTDEEFEIIRRHPDTGYQILRSVDEYAPLAQVVLHHHERWDGQGYPSGLKGEAIPLESRIIAVADAFEAMTAQRSYQKTKSKEGAMRELERCAGTQFDPMIVKLFVIHI